MFKCFLFLYRKWEDCCQNLCIALGLLLRWSQYQVSYCNISGQPYSRVDTTVLLKKCNQLKHDGSLLYALSFLWD